MTTFKLNRSSRCRNILMQTSSKQKKVLAMLTVFGCMIMALPAFAQSLGTAAPAPIQYIVSPENPGPNALVYIEAQGIGNFLGNSNVVWTENGKTVSSGAGVRTFSFTTGPVGTETIIGVSIDTTGYGLITHSFDFNPSLINLVWEANTTIPPFYAGKPLASPGSSIRVVAFPDVMVGGVKQDASNISFQWKLDDVADPSQSGLGRNVFMLSANQLHMNADVTVDAQIGNATAGHGEIVIPFSQPQIVFYMHDPLRGVLYNQALGSTLAMPAQEETLRAEPYFFSIESIARDGLQFSWQLNGTDTTGPNTAGGELTVRQTGSGQGSATVSASMQNSESDKLLQAASAALTVTFGGSSNSSLFGL